jgi:hypothetical protein
MTAAAAPSPVAHAAAPSEGPGVTESNSGVAALPPVVALAPEWERLQFLGYCLTQSRQGKPIEEREVRHLRGLQARVDRLRSGGGVWPQLVPASLTPLELDVLACVLGPDLEPRLGWMYQALQLGATQPYPSRALIQELLALESPWVEALQSALEPEAPLCAHRLIRVDRDSPYRPLLPESWLTARALGRRAVEPPPPGAVRVETRASWESLILPAGRKRMLREFMMWIRHRDTVVGRWGGAPVGGPVALFSGPSGTGKTLAAAVIADELGWPLYRVDLGRLVSKYVGETEQNLNALFDAAHGRPMVLQFDEADSLFAKRGEVKEARDRYANMEVSHLLARIEVHHGPCILTTNLRKQLDPAFSRRFQMVVEFPRPDVQARVELWRHLLPPRAPRETAVRADFLGAAVGLTGGGIRNAALHAAYLAAADSRAISLGDVALAVWREITKEGRDVSPKELGPLLTHLPEDLRD